MGQPRPLFVYFRSFQIQFNRKIVDFSGIRTQIVGVEGEHADHHHGPDCRYLLDWTAAIFNQRLCKH